MASRSNTPHWEAPMFSFNAPNQTEEWKSFYTRVLDFLEALDIGPDVEDQDQNGWHQIKMMFKGEDCQALQTLIENKTISPDAQWTPTLVLKAIQSVTKKMCIFGTIEINSCEIFANSQKKVHIASPIESIP